jgi:hypothetical protein
MKVLTQFTIMVGMACGTCALAGIGWTLLFKHLCLLAGLPAGTGAGAAIVTGTLAAIIGLCAGFGAGVEVTRWGGPR